MEDRRRQTTEQEVRRPLTRVYPFDPLTIAGTATGSADTFFTVADGTTIKVEHIQATNTSASPVTLSIHVIPSGGSIGATNLHLDTLSIGANTTVRIDEMLHDMWTTGDVIQVYASTTAVVNLRGWGTEYR